MKVGEKQQRDPQTWTEVKTKKSKRIHPNIYESKIQNSEGQNSENNSEYWWGIESKHVRKVKEGNHQLSGDSKGLIRPEVKISLEKAEGASIKKLNSRWILREMSNRQFILKDQMVLSNKKLKRDLGKRTQAQKETIS
ncbi:hypothetical protein F521_05580 [Enterococcus hirae 67-03-C5]|nr:hypothetical protein F521_05580 [Enterococcus hirae 67-03-C5]